MKLISALTAFLLLSAVTASAQNKMLAIDDLMNRKLSPASLSGLQWRSPSLFTWTSGGKMIQGSTAQSLADTLKMADDLNAAAQSKGFGSFKSLPALKWENENSFYFTDEGRVFRYSISGKEIVLVNAYDKNAENADLEPNTGRVAFTSGNNLFVADQSHTLTVTSDTNTGIVNGQSVHRNEFGIHGGTFWSPKGNLLAFYRMDETMVSRYPLVNIDERIAAVEYIRYPMAGTPSHHVTLGVFNPKTGSTVFLKTGEPAEQYLTNVSWSPDEKSIYIAVLNRDQNHMWLNQYDVVTGNFVKTLFEETDAEYVEPLNPLLFLKSDPSLFIWQSRRDGFNHLYLYNTDGSLVKQLTSGPWEVTALTGWDKEEKKLYFTSTQESPLERHLYCLERKNGKITRLTNGSGTHTVWLSPDGKFFIDRFSSLNTAARYSLINEKGENLRTISEDINPLKDYRMGETRFVSLKSEDGSDLYARMILPPGFDAAKRYPVLVYVYGGPHSQLVSNTWLGGTNLYFNYLAQQGYIVWTLDNRGTSNRGAAFEQIIHRHLGDAENADQMVGVNYLKSLPYVDASRIGVDGWSYGGFMTLTLILRNPGVFKVATCGGPVIDWKYYEVMYGERYMDTPEQNPDGYAKASILNQVDSLNTTLLVMHGAQDNTVVWQNSLQFIQICIKKGKQVDYFVYPQHEHNVMGTDRLHMFRKLAEYYQQNL
jgi:dipeptidyl-peptidase 4